MYLSKWNDAKSAFVVSDIDDATVTAAIAAVATAPLQLKKDIANAAVRTLNATPVEVIPAPGAGKYIEIISATYWFKYTAPAFDAVGASDNLVLKYTDASGAELTGVVAGVGFGDATADKQALRNGVDFVPVANAAVVAHIKTGEWYAAAGGGALSIEVEYRIRNASF